MYSAFIQFSKGGIICHIWQQLSSTELNFVFIGSFLLHEKMLEKQSKKKFKILIKFWQLFKTMWICWEAS